MFLTKCRELPRIANLSLNERDWSSSRADPKHINSNQSLSKGQTCAKHAMQFGVEHVCIQPSIGN